MHSTIMRRLLALLCVASLSFLVAACGGDSGDTSGSDAGARTTASTTSGDDGGDEDGEPLSEEDYIEATNEAQEDFAEAAGKLDLANPKDAADFQQKLRDLSPHLEQITEDLEDITPPEDVEDEHEDLIETLEQYDEDIRENLDGLTSKDNEEVQASAQAIADASNEFSTSFDRIINEINSDLGVETPTSEG